MGWRWFAAALLWAGAVMAQDFAPDPPNLNHRLPASYPEHWLVVHDATFFHMREGRILFVDPQAETVGGQVRAMLSADFMATYEQSPLRQEHYVVESFFSRGGRGGERTDVVTIYDSASLAVEGEVIIRRSATAACQAFSPRRWWMTTGCWWFTTSRPANP